MAARSFLLTIDVDWIPGSESGVLGLCDLCEEHELRATVFVAGRFAERYPSVIAAVARRGHQLGTHGWAHGQLAAAEDEDFGVAPRAQQLRWIRQATRAVEDAAGVSPRVFRAPNLSISEPTLGVLAELGYTHDSSVPARRLLVTYGATGRRRHYRAPLAPYHPSLDDLTLAGSSTVLEVPPSAFLVPLNMSALRVLGLPALRWAARRVSRRSPILVFYAHPAEFVEPARQAIPGDNPRRHRRGLGPQNFARLAEFLRFVRVLGHAPATFDELTHADCCCHVDR